MIGSKKERLTRGTNGACVWDVEPLTLPRLELSPRRKRSSGTLLILSDDPSSPENDSTNPLLCEAPSPLEPF